METEEEPYADITINLPNIKTPSNEYIFISDEIDRNLQDFLIDKEIIGEPITYVKYNRGQYNYVKVDLNKLKEFDLSGFNEYKKVVNKNKGFEL